MMELVLLASLVFGPTDNNLVGADNQLLGDATIPAMNEAESDEVEDAVARSIRTGKPVILWVGGNFCDRCVNDSKDEFIHVFLKEWRGHRGPATVILAPHGKRTYRVATVDRWTVGSHDWGHIPSARRLVHEWRSRSERGNLAPLPLMYLSGGHWGWPADRKQLSGPASPYRVQPIQRIGGS